MNYTFSQFRLQELACCAPVPAAVENRWVFVAASVPWMVTCSAALTRNPVTVRCVADSVLVPSLLHASPALLKSHAACRAVLSPAAQCSPLCGRLRLAPSAHFQIWQRRRIKGNKKERAVRQIVQHKFLSTCTQTWCFPNTDSVQRHISIVALAL